MKYFFLFAIVLLGCKTQRNPTVITFVDTTISVVPVHAQIPVQVLSAESSNTIVVPETNDTIIYVSVPFANAAAKLKNGQLSLSVFQPDTMLIAEFDTVLLVKSSAKTSIVLPELKENENSWFETVSGFAGVIVVVLAIVVIFFFNPKSRIV